MPQVEALKSERVDSLDGVRGVCLLVVVWTHMGLPFAERGYLALEPFFVLSGYLITRTLMGRTTLRRFYWRRMLRLFPALAGMVVTTFALRALVIPESRPDLAAWLAAVTSLSAWYYSLGFDDQIYAHTWSLSVEEAFYFVWPICMLLVGHRAGKSTALLVAAGGVLSYAAGAVVHFNMEPSVSGPGIAYFLPPLRFGGILFGCALALHLHRSGSAGRFWFFLASLPGSPWLLIAGAFLIDGGQSFGVHSFALAFPMMALATVLIILRVGSPKSQRDVASRMLACALFRLLGKASYSLYLWHIFVINAVWALNHRRFDDELHGIYTCLIQLVIILVVGTASYWLLERPYLRWASRQSIHAAIETRINTPAAQLALRHKR